MASVPRKLLTSSANDTLYDLCSPYCDPSNDSGLRLKLLRPNRSTRREEEISDEDHGQVVDHHIWYINTIGLQPSVISSIEVCKYKRGDGLVEGIECSVCLAEFEEDETLRLLPKCSHAFHIACIDTWLRSHTNCPLCRAPVVASTVREGPPEGGDGGGIEREGIWIIVPENSGGSGRGIGGSTEEFIRGGTEEGDGGLRRSVSLDSLSALKIRTEMGNTQRQIESGENDSGSRGSSRRAGRSQRIVQLVASYSSSGDSGGRSLQAGSSSGSVIRSFSCSGKLYNSKNRNSALPL